MNNTKKRTNLTIVAIFMAATLVVGIGTAAGSFLTKTAFAASSNNNSGNTITIQKCKQAAIQSGFDNNQEQECENLICTHPGENPTCVQEGAVVTPTPTPVKLTCEQCFTKFLSSTQITRLLQLDGASLEEFCSVLPGVSASQLGLFLEEVVGLSESQAAQIIQ